HPEENIFDIETPVAIVTLLREGAGSSEPAVTRYRRVRGTRTGKIAELETLMSAPNELSGWVRASDGWFDSLVPSTGDSGWETYPALTDLFPWQQPGCKFGRTWPIAPDKQTLAKRWTRFVSTDDPVDRARCFVTATSGRSITTRVGDLPRLVDV